MQHPVVVLVRRTWLAVLVIAVSMGATVVAQTPSRERPAAPFPATLPSVSGVATDRSPLFLQRPDTIDPDVTVATAIPTIDFVFYPGQDHPGNPWSNWGGGVVIGDTYYSAIGDHLDLGTVLVFAYDATQRQLRQVLNVSEHVNVPEGHYTPGKIHSHMSLGDDGWIYFSTHRGTGRATGGNYPYEGDWILRYHPGENRTQTIAQGPVPKHTIPYSAFDPERLIFYGGARSGDRHDPEATFFAYDTRQRKLLYSGPNGPPARIIHSRVTGFAYYPARDGSGWMRFDPQVGRPVKFSDSDLTLRTSTLDTPQGLIYATASDGQIYSFDPAREQFEVLGPGPVGTRRQISALVADPTGRYLYYSPGAHGGTAAEGTPVVQFDTRTNTRKIIAFLHPFYAETYGYTPDGTFEMAIDERGEQLFITWNGMRAPATRWETCVMTVIHIPESERPVDGR